MLAESKFARGGQQIPGVRARNFFAILRGSRPADQLRCHGGQFATAGVPRGGGRPVVASERKNAADVVFERRPISARAPESAEFVDLVKDFRSASRRLHRFYCRGTEKIAIFRRTDLHRCVGCRYILLSSSNVHARRELNRRRKANCRPNLDPSGCLRVIAWHPREVASAPRRERARYARDRGAFPGFGDG